MNYRLTQALHGFLILSTSCCEDTAVAARTLVASRDVKLSDWVRTKEV